MKRNLKDTLVFCDMDNTLLTAKEGIPECNRTVIKLFTGMGGRFTVASGRPPESVRAALGDICLSLPAICCNGSLLYDFSTERVLRHATLERGQATAAILEIMEKFPPRRRRGHGRGRGYVRRARQPLYPRPSGGRTAVRRGLPAGRRARRLGSRSCLRATPK